MENQKAKLKLIDMSDVQSADIKIITAIERLGIEYEEREDGLLYPMVDPIKSEEEQLAGAGKYGRMWARFMEDKYPLRYRTLLRNEELGDRASQVNEFAYVLYEDIVNDWLRSHKPKNRNSFAEIFRIRSQAAMMAEEMVLVDVVNVWH